MYHHERGPSPPSDTDHLELTCGFTSRTIASGYKTAGHGYGVQVPLRVFRLAHDACKLNLVWARARC